MRTKVAKVALIAVFIVASVAFVTVPARADGGAPFQPGDSRVNPMTGDKVAVYCNPSSIDVLGIDGLERGFFLTTFTTNEISSSIPTTHMTPDGNVTLTLLQAPQFHVGFKDFVSQTPSLIFDTGATYHVSWSGGSIGADGSLPFVKTFSCAYSFVPASVAAQANGTNP